MQQKYRQSMFLFLTRGYEELEKLQHRWKSFLRSLGIAEPSWMFQKPFAKKFSCHCLYGFVVIAYVAGQNFADSNPQKTINFFKPFIFSCLSMQKCLLDPLSSCVHSFEPLNMLSLLSFDSLGRLVITRLVGQITVSSTAKHYKHTRFNLKSTSQLNDLYLWSLATHSLASSWFQLRVFGIYQMAVVPFFVLSLHVWNKFKQTYFGISYPGNGSKTAAIKVTQ